MIITGKVHKFGDNINTDDIISAKYLDSQDMKFLGEKCMESIRPDFSLKVTNGDIIVAGNNFGCGSSREHAPLAIKGLGIQLVIAKSFARIFYRNSINIGLPILESEHTGLIKEGSKIKADLEKGIVYIGEGKILHTEKFPEFLQDIIQKGGLISWAKKTQKGK